jgi:hypothetical protein
MYISRPKLESKFLRIEMQWPPLHIIAKLSLWLIKHYAMKMYGGVNVQFYAFLPSVLDLSEWSISHHGRFNPRKKAPGSHWMGGRVNPKAGLGATQNRNISRSAGDRTPISRPYSSHFDSPCVRLCVYVPVCAHTHWHETFSGRAMAFLPTYLT